MRGARLRSRLVCQVHESNVVKLISKLAQLLVPAFFFFPRLQIFLLTSKLLTNCLLLLHNGVRTPLWQSNFRSPSRKLNLGCNVHRIEKCLTKWNFRAPHFLVCVVGAPFFLFSSCMAEEQLFLRRLIYRLTSGDNCCKEIPHWPAKKDFVTVNAVCCIVAWTNSSPQANAQSFQAFTFDYFIQSTPCPSGHFQ